MRLIMKLLPALLGLGLTPWLFVWSRSTSSALTEHTWFGALVFATVALSLVVLAHVVRDEIKAPILAISDAVIRSQAAGYDTSVLSSDPNATCRDFLLVVEQMRVELKDRELKLLTALDKDRSKAYEKQCCLNEDMNNQCEARDFFTRSLYAAIEDLANGNFSTRLDQPYSQEYEPLRHRYNECLDQLSRTFSEAISLILKLDISTIIIASAADSLSNRTCQQAASLEQTAASLKQIATTVSRTADGARSARDVVAWVRQEAEGSRSIVREAIEAMDRIEKSSHGIEQIISVIDDIAFQTDLLALNAGVEAARAGEAGRGFAVVASEVRALAQRSADAAKGIKRLIGTSTAHVQDGVKLVGLTGGSLNRIVAQVAEASSAVSEIAVGAKEQSVALGEISGAMAQMDQFTQQNAAMVEEATAATQSLRTDIGDIVDTMSKFVLGEAIALQEGRAIDRQAEAPSPLSKVRTRRSRYTFVSRDAVALKARIEPDVQHTHQSDHFRPQHAAS